GAAARRALVAFGDPKYPSLSPETAEGLANPEVRRAVRRGHMFLPLPYARREVQAVQALFPAEARTYLGAEATEENAKAVGREAGIVHFACHAFFDPRLPLNSALALTIPEQPAEGQDNGLLQAWEILERVRLDADLVTLSACESGLGAEMG